jgi:integrase
VSAPGTPADSLAPLGIGHRGLLASLVAAVRPGFRRDELVFDPEDPVFGGRLCKVSGCGRTARGRGLCEGHHQRWADEGRPDLDSFAATTSPRWRRQQPNAACRVPGCGYGVARGGLCQLHAQRWQRSGRPPLDAWLAGPPAVRQLAPDAACLISHCGLWPQADLPYCHAHAATWKVNGRPGPEQFALRFTETGIPGHERIYLHQLGPQLKLELQYALQCRHDERRSKLQPFVAMLIIRFLATCPVASLLDRTEQEWRQAYGRPAPKDSTPRAFLVYARRRVEDLAGQGGGWDTEYPRDIWRLHNVGFPGRQTLGFGQIPQPWLKDLAKRWVRWRLSTGLCLEASRRAVRALTRFAQFLASPAVNAGQLAEVNRPVLERYLADLHAEMAGSQRQGSHIGLLNAFFQAIRQHGWDTTLPASATFFAADYPKRAERLPRALAEHVMTQVEHPGNLARWDNPAYRLVTLVLIRCGLRISDALRLRRDCVVTDADAAPYLRYFNHKMKREALVPIDEELQDLISHQQRHVLDRWPEGTPGLFPRPTSNLDGQAATSSSTYRLALYRWLEHCDIRDDHGRPVHFTPHQWRHTLGTSFNRDVPQEVVRRILDHDSAQMTGHYARLSDTTIRRHWEKARKVNASGQAVTLDPGGPLAEAAWAKQRISRATQALPNGYCGLPLVRQCPHANACLTCPMFITTAEFLPQHRGHHQQVLQIISAAQAAGQTRLAEMNQQVASNLAKIITTLEDDPSGTGPEETADAS